VFFSLMTVVVVGMTLLMAFEAVVGNQILQSRVLEEDNVTGRVERINVSWERFWEKPLLGWGPGALDVLLRQEFGLEKGFNVSHNTYMTMLVDGGLLQFLTFIALIIAWAVQSIQVFAGRPARSFERGAAGVLLGSIVVYLMSGFALELRFFSYFTS